MYSSHPVKKIVGKFSIENIVEDNPKSLWDSYKPLSGLDENSFFTYFDGVEKGFAIEIKDVKMFDPIEPSSIFSVFHPPQSYCYINHDLERHNQDRFLIERLR
jgi:predicted transcriptional regulator